MGIMRVMHKKIIATIVVIAILFTGYSCLATGLTKDKNFTQNTTVKKEVTIKVIGILNEKYFPLIDFTYIDDVKLDSSATSVTLERKTSGEIFTASYCGEEGDYLVYNVTVDVIADDGTGCSRPAYNTFTTTASSSEEFESASDYRWIPGRGPYPDELIILNLYYKNPDDPPSKAAPCLMFLDYIKMLCARFFK